VLEHIVVNVKLFARLGLAFGVHDESESSNYKGSFLACLKYLTEFYGFLKLHLENYQYCGSGTTNYLYHQIYKFVVIMADHSSVKNLC
jgi:hypothetical protein